MGAGASKRKQQQQVSPKRQLPEEESPRGAGVEVSLATARKLFDLRGTWQVDFGALADGSLDPAASERAYQKAFHRSGGPEAVKLHAATAKRWSELVEVHGKASFFSTKQAPHFRGYPLSDMVDSLSQGSLRQFGERELENLATELREFAPALKLTIAPPKSAARAAIKVKLKYMNDPSHLVDLNRCSMVVDEMKTVYAVVEHVARKWAPGAGVARPRLMSLEDRVAEPLRGGYRDFQLLVDLSGALWEVQLTTEAMLDAKEREGGHVVYETTRFAQEMVLFCAIDGDLATLKEMLSMRGVRKHAAVDAKKDLNGMRALHHAAARGDEKMVALLLKLGADPTKMDAENATPLFWAMRMHNFDIAASLAKSTQRILRPTHSTESHKAGLVRVLQLSMDIAQVVPEHLRRTLDDLHERCDRPSVANDGSVVQCAKCKQLLALWNQQIFSEQQLSSSGDPEFLKKGTFCFTEMHGVRVKRRKAWGEIEHKGKIYPNAVLWETVSCAKCQASLGLRQAELNFELLPSDVQDDPRWSSSRRGCYLVEKLKVDKLVELAVPPEDCPEEERLLCLLCGTYLGRYHQPNLITPRTSWVESGEQAIKLRHLVNVDFKSGFWGDVLIGGRSYKNGRLWKPAHCLKCDTYAGLQTCKHTDAMPEQFRLEGIGSVLRSKRGFHCAKLADENRTAQLIAS